MIFGMPAKPRLKPYRSSLLLLCAHGYHGALRLSNFRIRGAAIASHAVPSLPHVGAVLLRCFQQQCSRISAG
jgi:hypothetical protein